MDYYDEKGSQESSKRGKRRLSRDSIYRRLLEIEEDIITIRLILETRKRSVLSEINQKLDTLIQLLTTSK